MKCERPAGLPACRHSEPLRSYLGDLLEKLAPQDRNRGKLLSVNRPVRRQALLLCEKPAPPDQCKMARRMKDEPVTDLLRQLSGGDKSAEGELFRRVYGELRELAAAYLRRERDCHTLQATALVNEAYFRLTGQRSIEWENRHHFFGIAAKVMRRILSDYARKRQASKRGGGSPATSIDQVANLLAIAADDPMIVDLDEALDRLEVFAPRQAQVLELRFFGGFEEPEIAEMLEVCERTVKRDWQKARAWLRGELGGQNARNGHVGP